jgi:hypothetical protein
MIPGYRELEAVNQSRGAHNGTSDRPKEPSALAALAALAAALSYRVVDRPVSKLAVRAGFLFLVVLAFGVRAYGINFGLPHVYYWDEPIVVNRAIRFGSGDLNPDFSWYGAFYMYVIFIVTGIYFVLGFLIGQFKSVQDFGAQYFVDPTGVYLVARLTTVVLGTACVLVTYWVGKKFFGHMVGYIGAIFFSVSVLSASNSHLAIPDVPQALFIIAAYLPIHNILIAPSPRWRDYLLAGFLIGLGTATKNLAGLMVFPLLLAHLLSANRGPAFASHWPGWLACWLSPKLFGAGGATLAAFIGGSPFQFVGRNTVVATTVGLWVEYDRDERGTTLWTILTHTLPDSFGWPLYLLGLAGLLLMAWQRSRAAVLFLSFPVIYVLVVSRFSAFFPRYMIPVEPFLAVMGAHALTCGFQRLRTHFRVLSRPVASLGLGWLVVGLVVVPLFTNVRWNALVGNETDTRTRALEWAHQNIPEGTTIAVQPLYDRTFLNAPVMTDKKLEKIMHDIPQAPRFAAVRSRVQAELHARPAYREAEFVYDYGLLKAAGVKYIFISDQNWPTVVTGTADPTSAQATFKTELETQALLVQQFVPSTELYPGRAYSGVSVLPLLPPAIRIYHLS